MEKVRMFLEGKKTYGVAFLVAVLAGAKHLGYVDAETFQVLMTLLAGGGLAALRAGVNRR